MPDTDKFIICLIYMTLKISLIDLPSSKKIPKNINLDEYIEISVKYIKLLKNCWIKYTDKNSLVTFQGGFLIGFTVDTITLRNIKQEIFELTLLDYIFYCKKDNEQYQAVKELILEKQKLSTQIEEFNKQKRIFLEQKKKFFLDNSK